MQNKNIKINKKNQGFTIIETVISIAIFAVISVALLNLFNVVLRNIRNNNAILTANSVALEQMETVRGMDFDNVKTDTGWVPAGPIVGLKTFDRGGMTFTVKTDISWADDPFDGLDTFDSFPFDYKKVRVRINWRNPINGSTEEISMSTTIVPVGIEGLSESKGGLYISVFDAEGLPVYAADVKVVSASLGYSLDNAQTDVNGNLWIPDLDPANDYHIEATKLGYSMSQTYAVNNNPASPDYNPVPEKNDTIVIAQKVSKLGFAIDVLGSMKIRTVNFDNPDNVVVNANSLGEQINPSVAVYSDDIYMAWEDSRNGGNEIYMQKFVYSSSGGTYVRSWSSDVMLKNNTGCKNPKLEVSGSGLLYLVWRDERDGDSDIYLQGVSVSDGSLVGNEYKVNNDSSPYLQENPSVDSDQDGNLYIVWEDNRGGSWDIYGQIFSLGSNSFRLNDLKINSIDSAEQLLPQIVLDRDSGGSGENLNNFYVVWQSNDSGDFDIMIRKFNLSGEEVFGEKMINSDASFLDQYNPTITFDGGEYFYIAWSDDRNSQPDIYMQKISKTGVLSFADDKKINDDAFAEARRFNPSIFYGSDSEIYLVWEDSRNGDTSYNIYAARIDSVANRLWEYDLVLADTLESSQLNPSLLMARGKAVTIWGDNRGGDSDIYLATYDNLGNVTNANIPIRVISNKTKGSYPNPVEEGSPEFLPIPKYSKLFISDAAGNIVIDSADGGLEWGSYYFETESPYSIKSIDLPSPISVLPGAEASVVINVEN
jgi:prepilin-type N-terminal cleavage/methylation domain-containing protein